MVNQFGDFVAQIQSDEHIPTGSLCTCIEGDICGFCDWVGAQEQDHANSQFDMAYADQLTLDDISFMNSQPTANC